MKYELTITVNYSDLTVQVECPTIGYRSESSLQADTVAHILIAPVKLIISEAKKELKAV